MWAGIIVTGVVIALLLLARLVLSGPLGRLRQDGFTDNSGNLLAVWTPA